MDIGELIKRLRLNYNRVNTNVSREEFLSQLNDLRNELQRVLNVINNFPSSYELKYNSVLNADIKQFNSHLYNTSNTASVVRSPISLKVNELPKLCYPVNMCSPEPVSFPDVPLTGFEGIEPPQPNYTNIPQFPTDNTPFVNPNTGKPETVNNAAIYRNNILIKTSKGIESEPLEEAERIAVEQKIPVKAIKAEEVGELEEEKYPIAYVEDISNLSKIPEGYEKVGNYLIRKDVSNIVSIPKEIENKQIEAIKYSYDISNVIKQSEISKYPVVPVKDDNELTLESKIGSPVLYLEYEPKTIPDGYVRVGKYLVRRDIVSLVKIKDENSYSDVVSLSKPVKEKSAKVLVKSAKTSDLDSYVNDRYPVIYVEDASNLKTVPDGYIRIGNYLVRNDISGNVQINDAYQYQKTADITKIPSDSISYVESDGYRYYVDNNGNVIYSEKVENDIKDTEKVSSNNIVVKTTSKVLRFRCGAIEGLYPKTFTLVPHLYFDLGQDCFKYVNMVGFDYLEISCYRCIKKAVNLLKSVYNENVYLTDGWILIDADFYLQWAANLLDYVAKYTPLKDYYSWVNKQMGISDEEFYNKLEQLENMVRYYQIIEFSPDIAIVIITDKEITNIWEVIANDLGIPYIKM